MKFNNLLFTVMVLCATVIAIYSCQKEQDNLSVDSAQVALSPEDAAIINKIEAFKEKLSTKSSETMNPSELLWNIEATMNYTYGVAENELVDLETNKFIIEVPLNENGEVSIEDVTEAYNEVLEGVREHYHGIEVDQKNLLMVDLEEYEEEGLKSTSTVMYEVTSTVNVQSVGIQLNFGENDYWNYGNGGGYCDGPLQGQSPDSDAAQEIQKKIHQRKAVPAGRYWYENPMPISVVATDYDNFNDPISGDNYREYLMYASNIYQPNGLTCLSPDDMNFYLNGTEYVVYHYDDEQNPGARPQGKDFVSIDIWGDIVLDGSGNYLHMGFVWYGILHTSTLPPDEL